MPLRVIFRRALRDDAVALNPCDGIELPANRGRRDRIVSVEHAAKLISALTESSDRALWACALYAGLRRGELMAFAGVTLTSREGRCTSSVRMTRRPASTSSRSHAQADAGCQSRARCVTRSTGIGSSPGAWPRRPRFRGRRATLRLRRSRCARSLRLQGRWPRPGRPPRGTAHGRERDDCCRGEPEGAQRVPRARLHHHNVDRYGHLLPGSIGEATKLLDAYLAGASAAVKTN